MQSTTPLSVRLSSEYPHYLKMEADCKDNSNDMKMSPEMANIAQMISNLSNQMTHQNQSIEEKIIKNEMKFSDDFRKIVE